MRAHYLGHVVFYIQDMARSLAFYRDLLGFKEIGRTFGGAEARDLTTPDLEGQEANLSMTISLPDGPPVTTTVRVVLTHDHLPDLPEL